ncbi:response regulator transcription factor [Lacrimispora sp. NSJ-141]|uniref:Stage 0 sporulation protein A homolog n=1 Tax=Lientehia hominis TaxID=2897778 RepID=A0AAP2RL74_9FIRM|nr:response regulator transcription factor [Lientehia hominis]MCD2492878.1 response regulator transcription factor [Lientehia hominis]
MENKILIIEDNEAIADLIEMNLVVTGYRVKKIADGNQVSRLLTEDRMFDLAIVDIMLPGKNGFELLPYLRQRGIPVIFLTAKDDVASKIKGLKEGAEDYIVKPFEVLELLVRIEKVLERTGRLQKYLSAADIKIYLDIRTVMRGKEEIHLKPLEYDLLVLLVRNKNVTFTRERLLKEVWGDVYIGETRTVDVHIGQLRKKLGIPELIQTIPKIGYRLEDGT